MPFLTRFQGNCRSKMCFFRTDCAHKNQIFLFFQKVQFLHIFLCQSQRKLYFGLPYKIIERLDDMKSCDFDHSVDGVDLMFMEFQHPCILLQTPIRRAFWCIWCSNPPVQHRKSAVLPVLWKLVHILQLYVLRLRF